MSDQNDVLTIGRRIKSARKACKLRQSARFSRPTVARYVVMHRSAKPMQKRKRPPPEGEGRCAALAM